MANDSAASIAAGGLQPTRERRIAMRRERLFISPEKVRVEYEFANDSAEDVVTEVAFPIPPFAFDFDSGPRGLDDFKLWVDGAELNYTIEAKASVNGKDLTSLLQKFAVDINSFGHFEWPRDGSGPFAADFNKLPSNAQSELIRAGAFDAEDHQPAWTVAKTYHWTTMFPAHGVVHVAHEYKPIVGFTPIETSELDPSHRKEEISRAKEEIAKADAKNIEIAQALLDDKASLDRSLSDACIDSTLRAGIDAAVNARHEAAQRKQSHDDSGDYIEFSWVDYILTTANSWKMPIGDFELVIEKPVPTDSFALEKAL